MQVRYTHATRESRDLGVVPLNGKEDRRIPQNAEVISVVRVLPNVLAGEDQVSSKCLLDSGMELVAPARSECCRYTRNQISDDGGVTSRAGKN